MSESLYSSLKESRDLALNHGDYAGTAREHENIVKIATRLLRTASGDEGSKLNDLIDQVKAELEVLADLVSELTQLSRGDGRGNEGEPRRAGERNGVADDPDVWPPPTPEAGVRNNARGGGAMDHSGNNGGHGNMPSWARPREIDSARRQSGGGGAVVSRRAAPDVPRRAQPEAAHRLRSERDSNVPSGRKRFEYLYKMFPNSTQPLHS